MSEKARGGKGKEKDHDSSQYLRLPSPAHVLGSLSWGSDIQSLGWTQCLSFFCTRQEHIDNIKFLRHKEILSGEYPAPCFTEVKTAEDQEGEFIKLFPNGKHAVCGIEHAYVAFQ